MSIEKINEENIKVIQKLSTHGKLRTSFYMHRPDIRDLYSQIGENISQLTTTRRSERGIEATFSNLIKFIRRGGIDRGAVADIIDITKILLIEYYMKSNTKMIDLANDEFDSEKYLRYIGKSRIIDPKQKDPKRIEKYWNGIPNDIREVIEDERKIQEPSFEKNEIKYKAYAWISDPEDQGKVAPGKIEKPVFASIFTEEWIESPHRIISYWPNLHEKGIFGRFESKSDNGKVIFIAPYWIWKEGLA